MAADPKMLIQSGPTATEHQSLVERSLSHTWYSSVPQEQQSISSSLYSAGLTQDNSATKEGMMQPRIDPFVPRLLSPGRCSKIGALAILRSSPITSLLSCLVGDWHVVHCCWMTEAVAHCTKDRSLCSHSLVLKISCVSASSPSTK